jgi:hypothetical protein
MLSDKNNNNKQVSKACTKGFSRRKTVISSDFSSNLCRFSTRETTSLFVQSHCGGKLKKKEINMIYASFSHTFAVKITIKKIYFLRGSDK